MEHIWIQTLAGFPLAIQTVRQMANVVLRRRISSRDTFAIPETVGKNWPTKFYQQHPELAKVKLRVMDQLRANAVNYERLSEWFEVFAGAMALPDVGRHNLYDINESGIQFRVLRQAKCLITTDTPRPIRRSPHNQESATVIECISAIGTSIQPTVIFSAKSHRNNWYPREGGRASGWHFAISPNGYTNN